MATSTGSWSLVAQDQSLTKCTQNNLLGRDINGLPSLRVTPQAVNSRAFTGCPQVAAE